MVYNAYFNIFLLNWSNKSLHITIADYVFTKVQIRWELEIRGERKRDELCFFAREKYFSTAKFYTEFNG